MTFCKFTMVVLGILMGCDIPIKQVEAAKVSAYDKCRVVTKGMASAQKAIVLNGKANCEGYL